jgi:hypothetical protein
MPLCHPAINFRANFQEETSSCTNANPNMGSIQMLDVESLNHAPLMKYIYGVLHGLLQGDAFRLLNNCLTSVCNLRDNLGLTLLPQVITDEHVSLHSLAWQVVPLLSVSLVQSDATLLYLHPFVVISATKVANK